MGVTPYAGVWIETTIGISYTYNGQVTPYAGVWIETPVLRDYAGEL